MKTEIVRASNSILSADSIDDLERLAFMTVSESSKRIYAQTYGLWKDWCFNRRVSPLDFQQVRVFLEDQHVTRATRRRQLSAMRLLVEMASIQDSRFEPLYKLLKKMKAPKINLSTSERDRLALNPSQVNKIFEAWSGESHKELRNRALAGILFLCGVRRSEAAALEWRDVDFTNEVIHVRDGKGEKERDVSIAGSLAIQALERWRILSGANRLYVFCSVNKVDRIGTDNPITPDAVYKIIQETEVRSGVKFAPHDARRTFITEALLTGTPIADVQAQAGHSNEATTLRYAQPVEAKERRGRFRLRYGG